MRPKFRTWAVVRLALVLLLAVAMAHAVWGWRAARALRQRVEALRGRGERVLAADFQPKQTLEQFPNAARDLRAATAIVDDDTEEAASVSWAPATRPVDPRAWPYLSRATAWFEPALRRVELAQAKPRCDWEHRIPSPAIDLLLPELNGLRTIQNVLVTAALVEHRDGRDDLVVRRLGQMLYLGDTCADTPAMVAHLVTLGIDVSAAAQIEHLTPELRIGAAQGDASADEVRKLIAALLDETTIRRGFATGMQAERMIRLDAIAFGGDDGRMNPASGYLARPWLHGQGVASIERSTRVIEALRDAADWPTAASRLDAVPVMSNQGSLAAAMDVFDVARRTTETHFIALTDRRLAAAALAVRLYEIDHGGARPQRLDELVPKYLPTIPLDAMAAGGQPIRYLPRADHPVLYSVGRNGADDAAAESAMPNAYGEIDEWRRLDRVFYLSGRQRQYIYIARPVREGAMGYASLDEGKPPWERDAAAAAAPTQPAWPPADPALPATQPALTPR